LAIVVLWLALAWVVGFVANRRGRDGINWFLFATIISPLVAGLLLWAILRKGQMHSEMPHIALDQQPKYFDADGTYAGIPYRVTRYNEIDAVMPYGYARFETMELFLAAAAEKTAA